MTVSDHKLHYASGTSIAQFPEDGSLLARELNDQGTYNTYYVVDLQLLGNIAALFPCLYVSCGGGKIHFCTVAVPYVSCGGGKIHFCTVSVPYVSCGGGISALLLFCV